LASTVEIDQPPREHVGSSRGRKSKRRLKRERVQEGFTGVEVEKAKVEMEISINNCHEVISAKNPIRE